jgi:hypothetical protein
MGTDELTILRRFALQDIVHDAEWTSEAREINEYARYVGYDEAGTIFLM